MKTANQTRHGDTRRPWLPCEEHGIPFGECWGCNKPTGMCGYGYCDASATHVGGGRRACLPHATYLADINGDSGVTPIRHSVHVAVQVNGGRVHIAEAVRVDGQTGEIGYSVCGRVKFEPDARRSDQPINCGSCLRSSKSITLEVTS